ncbi:MAG: amino acid permease [Gammaproteobacteria bacterium]|nr:amino acid permease [Gammaproteobacteria bacterium]
MQRRSPAVLGLVTLTALVVGNMIGAGVFTTSGFALADLGSPYRVLAAWVIGGLLALCGALSYGSLAKLAPESGGEYLYLSKTIHPAAGFVAGWVSLLAGFTGAIAYAALTFAAYAAPAAERQGGAIAGNTVATAVIAVAVLLHALKMRQGAWVQNAAVGLKLTAMLVFCAYAYFGFGLSSWAGFAAVAGPEPPPFSIAAFALTLMWISFSYSGFNAAVYLAGEVPSAADRVPRALLLGTALTMLFYLLLNSVFVLLPPFDAVVGQEDVAAVAAGTVGGQGLAGLVRAIVALALFTSVSAMIMVGPRVYAKMADDGLMPAFLRFEGETPTTAVLAQGVLAILVVWIAGLQQLLSYLGFTLGLSTAATVASLFVAVRRSPAVAHRLPGYPWAPIVFVAFTLLFAALAATLNPWEMVAAAATIGSGGLLYLLVRRLHLRRLRAGAQAPSPGR